MPPQNGTESKTRRLLGGALDREIALLDYRVAQVWQAIMLICLLISLVSMRVAFALGVWSSLLCVAAIAWFVGYARVVRRGRAGPWLSGVTTVVESALPWVFLLISFLTEGAAYALSSWVSPLLVMFLVMTAAMRLRPRAPLIIGIVGGIAFPGLYFSLLRADLSSAEASFPLYQPTLQLTRSAALILAGVVGMLISKALREAIAKAEAVQRQRDLFGKYRLVQEIASGGMGSVHEAIYCPEGGFERRVAVKRIHPHLAAQAHFVSAFRGEARLSAMLVHTNIVQVLDFGRIADTYFLAMEFVDGMTLAELMERGRARKIAIDPDIVEFVAREILTGLHFSHCVARAANGDLLRVIHRDLSPRNVLISKNGEVKITDFGVAKALREATSADTQHVAGSYGYMAPEQAQAEPLDERCDLFSLGVTLWELLVGERLFHKGAPGPTLMALVSSEVASPSKKRQGLDTVWDEVVMQALSRDRQHRHATARAMRTALPLHGASRSESVDKLAALLGQLA